MYGSTCQLLLNKPNNGRLGALFLEVTHAEFFRRELECTITAKGTKWNFKCPVSVAYLPVPAFWKATSTIPTDKRLGQLK